MLKTILKHNFIMFCTFLEILKKIEHFQRFLLLQIFANHHGHIEKYFFAELQELEHSAEGTVFRKIGNFSTIMNK